jgi:peroxiredoxin
MTNNLTGQYDAVVQGRIGAVNRILATLHQNGASKETSPSFLHSFALRVGDPGEISFENFKSIFQIINWAALAEALGNREQKGPPPKSGGGKKGSKTASKAPPGFTKVYEDMQKELQEALDELTTPATLRGTAQVQVSTPTVTFPPGSTSEIKAKVDLRANYIPDPKSLTLPQPIHGDLEAAFSVEPKVEDNQPVLEVKVTADDNQITFVPAPGTGLSATDATQIEKSIRSGLRENIEPMSLSIASDFPFGHFKGLGSGSNQVVALPVTLDGPAPPPSAINSINAQFLNPADDFGVAISREYIDTLMQPMLNSLKAFHKTVTFYFWVVYIFVPVQHSVSYNITISNVNLTWQSGSVKLTATGSAKTGSIFPNYNFTIQQSLTLAFNPATQSVALQAVGNPSISGLPNVALAEATSAVVQARDAAIASAQSAIQGALTGSITLTDILKDFDSSVNAKYTSLDIEPNGVVLHGAVTTKARSDMVVHFTETGDGEGEGFSALKSWIPAGTVERYEWSWLTGPIFAPWAMSTQVVTDEHRFVLPKPAELKSQVCLRVVGKQTPSSAGSLVGVSGGETCSVNWPEFVWMMPSWWETIMTPIWLPDPPPEAILDDFIVAHINTLANSRPGAAPGANTLVQFMSNPSLTPLETLGQTLSQRGRENAPLALFLVLPHGSLRERRSIIEERLESLGEEFAVWFAITEDYEGAWSRTFKAERTPATYLLNARGEFVWQQMGPLDGRSFSAALDEHMIPGQWPGSRLLRLAVKPGDRAPDLLFPYDEGQQMALRRLRGQRVLLNFWKSWSTPCLAELQHLQRMHDRSSQEGPVILAINDGENIEWLAEFRREHNLTFTLVPDPERRIARRYGVNCWPTTVSIDVDGLVNGIRLGKTIDRPVDRARVDKAGTRTEPRNE